MALTPQVHSSQAPAQVVGEGGFPVSLSQVPTQVVGKSNFSVSLSQSFQTVVVNFPANDTNTSFVTTSAIYTVTTPLNVSQLAVVVVARGRIENPKLRTWKFILDDHEIVVFRVGEDKTLIYDVTTQQWAWWSSLERSTWRANSGLNWDSPGRAAQTYGSNVVVGDDSTGILWILSPEQGWDESAAVGDKTPVVFRRRATAQVITRGRKFIPIYDVFLTASPEFPAAFGDTVTLNYSDDGGKTFINAGNIEVSSSDFNQEFAWRSLGRVQAPGRIFQILDEGAFARIDSLDINTMAAGE